MDVSRGNFHGTDLPGFQPRGKLLAIASDFRLANLAELRLPEGSDVGSAFFTCANLSASHFGSANVGSADFTGADLRGARLADVKNLTEEQLIGATTGPDTELPEYISQDVRVGWDTTSTQCRELVNTMTDLRAGAGYNERLQCPEDPSISNVTSPDAPLQAKESAALSRVCAARSGT